MNRIKELIKEIKELKRTVRMCEVSKLIRPTDKIMKWLHGYKFRFQDPMARFDFSTKIGDKIYVCCHLCAKIPDTITWDLNGNLQGVKWSEYEDHIPIFFVFDLDLSEGVRVLDSDEMERFGYSRIFVARPDVRFEWYDRDLTLFQRHEEAIKKVTSMLKSSTIEGTILAKEYRTTFTNEYSASRGYYIEYYPVPVVVKILGEEKRFSMDIHAVLIERKGLAAALTEIIWPSALTPERWY